MPASQREELIAQATDMLEDACFTGLGEKQIRQLVLDLEGGEINRNRPDRLYSVSKDAGLAQTTRPLRRAGSLAAYVGELSGCR